MDNNDFFQRSLTGEPILIDAIGSGETSLVSTLINDGANINAKDDNGETCSHEGM